MSQEASPSATHEGMPIPPPTFEFLVLSVKMQAEMQLGLLSFGEESGQGPDLRAARHAIDMLAMLSEKTRGNLQMEEQRLIENALTELRFRFVQVTQEVNKAASAKVETPAAPEETASPDQLSDDPPAEEAKVAEAATAGKKASDAKAGTVDDANDNAKDNARDEGKAGPVKVTDRRTSQRKEEAGTDTAGE